MDISKLVHSDEALNVIDNGAWVDNIPGYEGVRFKVCGMKSEASRKLIESKEAALRAKNKGAPLTTDQRTDMAKQVLAEVVLKDWDGLTSNGEPLPYDKKLATKWLLSRNGEKLANVVLFAAEQIDGDAQYFVEQATKN